MVRGREGESELYDGIEDVFAARLPKLFSLELS